MKAATEVDGYEIELKQQPANSPDLNVLDLGFFASIQALQHQKQAYNMATMLKACDDAFNEYPRIKLENIFLTLQLVYDEVIKANGNNTFPLPHMGKEKLRKEGRLPSNIGVSVAAGAMFWHMNDI